MPRAWFGVMRWHGWVIGCKIMFWQSMKLEIVIFSGLDVFMNSNVF